MIRPTLSELSKATITPPRCAICRPHLEYEMDAVINHLARHQLSTFSLERRRHWADLILAFKIFQGEINLNSYDFFLRLPRTGLNAARAKSSSMKKPSVFRECNKMLEQIAGLNGQYYPHWPSLWSSWTINDLEYFPKSVDNYCSSTLTFVLIATPDFLYFFYTWTHNPCVCIYGFTCIHGMVKLLLWRVVVLLLWRVNTSHSVASVNSWF